MTRGADIQRIAREGKRIRTTHLEVRAVASPLARPGEGDASAGAGTRVGLVVPRFKHSAVDRNRLKRRLRELSRLRLLPLGIHADIVLRIRPEAYGATFDALASDVDRALVQLKRWGTPAMPAPEPSSGTNSGPAA